MPVEIWSSNAVALYYNAITFSVHYGLELAPYRSFVAIVSRRMLSANNVWDPHVTEMVLVTMRKALAHTENEMKTAAYC